jgi:hypothetical protein
MEKSRERSLARKIVRRVATNMKPFGYTLTKTRIFLAESIVSGEGSTDQKQSGRSLRPLTSVCEQELRGLVL